MRVSIGLNFRWQLYINLPRVRAFTTFCYLNSVTTHLRSGKQGKFICYVMVIVALLSPRGVYRGRFPQEVAYLRTIRMVGWLHTNRNVRHATGVMTACYRRWATCRCPVWANTGSEYVFCTYDALSMQR